MPEQESLSKTFKKGFKEIKLRAEKSGAFIYKIIFLQELEKHMRIDKKLDFNCQEIIDMADEATIKFNKTV